MLASKNVDFKFYKTSKLQHRFDIINGNSTQQLETSPAKIQFLVPERYPAAFTMDADDKFAIREILQQVDRLEKEDEQK